MDKKLVVLTAVFALSAGLVFAEEMKDEGMKAAAAPMADNMAAPAAVEAGNKICPISGEEIKVDEAQKVEYKGKIYNVCKMGKEMFDKNPDQYAEKFAALDAQMADEMKKEAAGAEDKMMDDKMMDDKMMKKDDMMNGNMAK